MDPLPAGGTAVSDPGQHSSAPAHATAQQTDVPRGTSPGHVTIQQGPVAAMRVEEARDDGGACTPAPDTGSSH
eukprot:4380672-Lingulodinium_polyedra.AAC.1